MTKTLGIVMDPISDITPRKDTSLALMLAAQQRGYTLHYFELDDLFVREGIAYGRSRLVNVRDDEGDWFDLMDETILPLGQLNALLMRKDPPFDAEYIYATYILDLAMQQGCRVYNRPHSLRDWNEKAAIARFPQCCAPTMISRDMHRLRGFIQEQQQAVLKPLDGMGGAGIFRCDANDSNLSVILETVTQNGQSTAMAQQFIPDISAGDKRILMINGKPFNYALARIPAAGELRGNLAAGGRGEGVPLSKRDHWICQQVGPSLVTAGLTLVGLDVIGDYLTEINVTSPTCMRELSRQYDTDIAGQVIDVIDNF